MTATVHELHPDIDRERCARLLREAVADLQAISRAKQAATQHAHLAPRPPARMTPEQLDATYRRAGIRNPRHRHHRRPILEVVA